MSQVPNYLFISNGRLSLHLQHYFSSLNISFTVWQRNDGDEKLATALQTATHVLILLADDAIASFTATRLLPLCNRRDKPLLIHCSGKLVLDYVIGAHPLMTFTTVQNHNDFYSQEIYESMAFVIDGDSSFAELFPRLPNPHVKIAKKDRPKYHAMCVLGANFSCLLWQKVFSTFEKEFGFSKEIAYPYLQQQMQNLMQRPEIALTGPLVRNDVKTIASHLDALTHDPFKKIYEAFVTTYSLTKHEERK